MTKLNKNTKKARDCIASYKYYINENYGSSLYEIYDSFSARKDDALTYCKDLKQRLNGFDACFCGHNSMIFTYAFLFIEAGILYLCYITPSYDYMIEYEG